MQAALAELVERQEDQTLVAEAGLEATKELRKAEEAHARREYIGLGVTVASVVLFVASNVYLRRFQYPVLFKWYDKMRAEPKQGEGKSPPGGYGMYQVATTMEFEPVGSMLNALTIWPTLSRAGALFLAQCVAEFSERGLELTSLHWAGSAAQTQAARLSKNPTAETGWASGGCSTTTTLGARQQTLVNNWVASRKQGNIWYEFLPDPLVDRGAFLSVPIITELYAGTQRDGGAVQNACQTTAFTFSDIYRLFDGGLSRIAFSHTNEMDSSADLFARFFVGTPTIPMSCGGMIGQAAAEASTAALMTTGSTAMMYPPGISGVTGGVFLVGVAAVTAVTTVVSGVYASRAAKDACRQMEEEHYQ